MSRRDQVSIRFCYQSVLQRMKQRGVMQIESRTTKADADNIEDGHERRQIVNSVGSIYARKTSDRSIAC